MIYSSNKKLIKFQIKMIIYKIHSHKILIQVNKMSKTNNKIKINNPRLNRYNNLYKMIINKIKVLNKF